MSACAAWFGESHCITLGDDGELWGFGRNTEHQLAVSDDGINVTIPTKIALPTKIVSASCGYNFTAALDEYGTLYTFGENDEGQLGIGTLIDPQKIQTVPGIPPVASVACGYFHTVVLDENHRVWSFGMNNCGQLGVNKKSSLRSSEFCSPTLIETISDIKQIACGKLHSIFLSYEGLVYGTGKAEKGRLAIHAPDDNILSPTMISIDDIVSIACYGEGTVFLDASGTVHTAGDNEYNQRGLCDTNDAITKLPNLPRISQISGNSRSVFCIDETGKLHCSGFCARKLGEFRTQNSICSISCGGNGLMLRDAEQNVWCSQFSEKELQVVPDYSSIMTTRAPVRAKSAKK
mmetsp:Transcript_11537/g.14302  ORF Transcript_11537/g.14302 Transcript_11537/m.14302 type:complete len:348 (-) Transcript_11537:62-1105(-)|eukprot:CAMPEP_0206185336 /NCGR_PEP_ID=MMETSP0166-20121206/1744_1 /ASSEMBLY_ACC=CAM_ASM_000260 /TAXON_ID=95228 /ORGANISM="Vannella robusta, Strain DIVA3 518/3/11/1/6" /LENGTH=347 /DNA_ID=CAMNT_0053600505 /DNA_START=506 /DNA_END=1549 /DNA_ORIENTATION=+